MVDGVEVEVEVEMHEATLEHVLVSAVEGGESGGEGGWILRIAGGELCCSSEGR